VVKVSSPAPSGLVHQSSRTVCGQSPFRACSGRPARDLRERTPRRVV
jgi:hypothetical protein